MANLTLNLPDDKETRIINGAAKKLGYQAQVPGPGETMVANPLSKKAFVKQHLANYLKALVKQAEQDEAGKTAADAAGASVDEISIN